MIMKTLYRPWPDSNGENLKSVFTHVASFYANLLEQRNCLHKKRVQLPQDLLGTPAWPPFHCFGTPIWSP